MASKSRRPSDLLATDVDAGPQPVDLTAVVVSGFLWNVLTRGVSGVTRFVVVVVLARLLTPEDYGVAGMALVATYLGLIFTDPALGAALIQRPTIDERDRSTVFWMATAIGAMLTILGIATSGLVAQFFGEAQVQELFVVTSLSFLVISLSVAHRALLARQLAYRSLEIREMVSIVTGGAVAVVVAVSGFGPWAVVANYTAYVLSSTILVWLMLDWRPRAWFSVDSARDLAGFSIRIFSATVLTWSNGNLDKALIGRFLGAASLGAYSLAFTAMLLPTTLLGRPVQQVLSPAFSRIQDDKLRLERAWLRSKRMFVSVVAPASLALVVVASDFVHVLFGRQWDDAIVPLQLLCLGGLAQALASLHWSLLQARGEAGTLLRLTFMSSVVIGVGLVIGLNWGIVGVSACYAGARSVLVLPTLVMMTRAVSFDFWAVLRASTAVVPLALVAAVVAFGAREALLAMETPAPLRLVLVGLVMATVYGALVRVFMPTLGDEIRETLRQRRREQDRETEADATTG